MTFHRLYIATLFMVVIVAAAFFAITGYSYYSLSIEERFFHSGHNLLKPSGLVGHGLGIAGSFLLLTGVGSYMIRKRYQRFSRLGLLRHWLEFHIFLCILGPILILYHTTFKFGGLVSISFWSMVAVVLSGFAGRYIYIQIPRTIEGKEMNLQEIGHLKEELRQKLLDDSGMSEDTLQEILHAVRMRPDRSGGNLLSRSFRKFLFGLRTKRRVREILRQHQVSGTNIRQVVGLISEEISLNRKIDRLITMQNMFRYWHIAHLPFALLMLIIMVIHIAVAIAFGAHWIF